MKLADNPQCITAHDQVLEIQKPQRVMSRDEAIAHAAWLVALADLLPGDGDAFLDFAELFDDIRKT